MSESLKETALAVSLVLVALIIGLLTDQLGWAIALATLVWVGLQFIEFRKVDNWARHPFRPPENGPESWFTLAYRPYRILLRERSRTRAMAARLREILSLAEVIPDAVIVLSQQGEIEGMNSAAENLLQLSKQDIGLSLATVVRNPDFIAFIRSGDPDEPLEFVYASDQERTYEARKIGTDNARTIMLVRDITALNRVLTMRQSFIANVSHELRTPLTVMNGYLETILDDEQEAALRLDLTKRMLSPLRRMQNLVNDLMLLARLESGPATHNKSTLRIANLIRSAVAELQPLCAHPDQIKTFIEADPKVEGNEGELFSVCTNLLDNAIRYSPEGTDIEVRLTADQSHVQLEVADQGYGIAPEHLSRLTERFYRVDLAGARTRGGTGLGLAIVKHVLLRHDSELEIKSKLGEGSTFSCQFLRADIGSN